MPNRNCREQIGRSAVLRLTALWRVRLGHIAHDGQFVHTVTANLLGPDSLQSQISPTLPYRDDKPTLASVERPSGSIRETSSSCGQGVAMLERTCAILPTGPAISLEWSPNQSTTTVTPIFTRL